MQMAKCLECLTLTHFLAKTAFSRGYGRCTYKLWKFLRVGGLFLCLKKWKFQGGGETCMKFPPWWGYGYFLELHILNV